MSASGTGLDDELLALAGGSARTIDLSDSSSDEKARTGSKRESKPSTTTSLAKKRRMDLLDESGSEAHAPGSADEDDASDEGGNADRGDPYPYQGIYKSARDMEELMSRNELEREDILARRRDEIQARRQKFELQALFKAQKAAAGATKKKRVVRGGRGGRDRGGSDESEESEEVEEEEKEEEKEEEEEEGSDYDLYGGAASAAKSRKKKLPGQTDAKSAKLSELRKKRKEKAAGLSSRKMESDDDARGSPVKGRGRRGYASDSASDVSYSSYSDDDEPSYSRGGKRTTATTSAGAGAGDSSDPPSVADLNAARITRELVESRLYAPRWRETLIGSFFRFSWGTRSVPASTTNPRGGSETIYRIHQVADVIENPGKFYDLSEDRSDRWCNVFLVFEHDNNEHEAKLNLLSRGDFTESERDRWMAWLKSSEQRVPKKGSVMRKADELEKFFTSPLTEADIKKMLDHKKRIRSEAASVMGKSALGGAQVDSPHGVATPGNATPTDNGNGVAQVQSLEARLAAVNERNRALDRSKMSDVERKARSSKVAALQAAKQQQQQQQQQQAQQQRQAEKKQAERGNGDGQGGVELTNAKPDSSGMGNGFVTVKNFATTVEVDLGDF
ncbi:related to RTF1 - subunit of the RNA polymerase II-associated Paf1 complex [Ustilago sp. UG-2017a]|nr:related to RTF1 - subunit of the RNA polymerase II-associated Paf1 complex [Ustilago sp. UG-2017a]